MGFSDFIKKQLGSDVDDDAGASTPHEALLEAFDRDVFELRRHLEKSGRGAYLIAVEHGPKRSKDARSRGFKGRIMQVIFDFQAVLNRRGEL
jgi:hypothetical protein